ncbi:hypothetical protein, partial [Enterobacter bugandensis]|uniref:hypothetical protein n=1 Tax=Enterobacter bugandensis TaxID=881260 RepID=UPI001C9825B8
KRRILLYKNAATIRIYNTSAKGYFADFASANCLRRRRAIASWIILIKTTIAVAANTQRNNLLQMYYIFLWWPHFYITKCGVFL